PRRRHGLGPGRGAPSPWLCLGRRFTKSTMIRPAALERTDQHTGTRRRLARGRFREPRNLRAGATRTEVHDGPGSESHAPREKELWPAPGGAWNGGEPIQPEWTMARRHERRELPTHLRERLSVVSRRKAEEALDALSRGKLRSNRYDAFETRSMLTRL